MRMPVLFFLLVLIVAFRGETKKLYKIRVAKGNVGLYGELYKDRTYQNQIEFDLLNKKIYRRKNESKKFKLTSNISFPSLLIDTTIISQLDKIRDNYDIDPCKIPEKNFFYRIDFIYCDRYPTYIETFEVSYNPISRQASATKTILEKIVDEYYQLTK